MKKFRSRILASALSVGLAVSSVPMTAFAAADLPVDDKDGYTLAWSDEFDDEELSLDDWNVEAHDPGWVNEELQRYVNKDEMSDNIVIDDGKLSIYPTVEEKNAAGEPVDLLEGFDGWAGGGAEIVDGKATVTVTNVGADPWDVQFQKAGLTIVEGHDYRFSIKARSSVARKVQFSVTETVDYKPFKDATVTLGEEEQEISFEFTARASEAEKGAVQINLGKIDDTDEGTALATVVFSDVQLIDLTESGAEDASVEVFEGNAFDNSWTGATEITDGTASIAIGNAGTNPWDVQFQKPGMTLTEGHDYKLSVTAKAAEARKMEINISNTADYSSFGSTTCNLGTDDEEYTLQFTMGACDEGKVAVQFNLGNFGEEDSALTTVTLSNISLIDLTAQAAAEEGGETAFNYKNYNYTSGRINTQNKHDFTYGYFECSARVPKGMGYLPAFWLMATDENEYGQWPQCGEIDIMEVMGQDTTKSYHTIHYGYDSGSGHRQNQGTKTVGKDEKDFYEDFHKYGLEWVPGKLTWYVDDVEVYTTSDWFTGKDEEGQLTYPAPFDHNMYVILNLAVGGGWVGYPDQAAVEDMNNQSFDIDYVRVYQLPEETYKKMEDECEKPENVIEIREPDEEGNLVVNGKFASDWPFADYKENEALAQEVLFAYKCGAISGFPIKDSELVNFKGEKNVTRAQFAIMLYNLAKCPPANKGTARDFSDVTSDNNAYAAVRWAGSYGIIGGFPNGSFKPNNYISRTQLLIMLSKFAALNGININDAEYDLTQFSDSADIPKGTEQILKWGLANGIIQGIGKKLKPNGDTRRDQCAAFLARAIKKFSDVEVAGTSIDPFELHLESDAKDSTYTVSDGAITIVPSVVGAQDYSIQLKQEGVPIRKGWEYTFSFDAYATENRKMIVNVEGPDNGWTRYFGDEVVDVTTEKKTYSFDFMMDKKSDYNSSVEFCLGNQGSTAPVTISNVSIKVKTEGPAEDIIDKTVRPDGNFVYNGTFDQGEKRLGYWEFDEADAEAISVTNDKLRRELEVKVVIPDGASEANPVVISQSELPTMPAGKYLFSFDAYTPDGDANGLTATLNGKDFAPELSADKMTYEFKVDYLESVASDDAKVEFRFTKPGVYYLDNVGVRENAIIKNASFEANLASYEAGSFNPGSAKFSVDSQNPKNNTACAVDIETVGNADWNVQLKQRGITLEKGKTYRLTFRAWATVDRTISAVMQRDGAGDGLWTVYSGDNNVKLTDDWQEFELVFTMNDETDTDVLLSVSLGKFDDIDEGVMHSVYMDDFALEEVENPT